MKQLEQNVIQWAWNKSIIEPLLGKERVARQLVQVGKMLEEVEELEEAIAVGDTPSSILELGDVLVCCVIQANLIGVDIEECLQQAYDKIAKRKGKTVGGVFIKED
jgi:NTP pyrophosphatase (non-canonical NTP hydrolase)